MEGETQDVLYGAGHRVYLPDFDALRSTVLPVSSDTQMLAKSNSSRIIFSFCRGVIGQHVAIIMGLVNETNPTTYRAVLIVATVALHNLMACKVYRLLKFDLIDVVSSSDIVTEQYGHNTIPDFAVQEDSSDNTVIYLQTIPHTSNSRDLHSPMEFYTHRDK